MTSPKSPNKYAIIFCGPAQSGKDLAATIAGSHLHKHGVSFVHTKFVSPFADAVNKMFGLIHSPAVYEDQLDELLPDFYGQTPRGTYEHFLGAATSVHGPAFLGRSAARRIRFGNDKVTIFSDCPNVDCIRAIATEVGPKNILLVSLKERLQLEAHDLVALNGMTHQFYPNNMDKAMLRTIVQAIVRNFMGIEE